MEHVTITLNRYDTEWILELLQDSVEHLRKQVAEGHVDANFPIKSHEKLIKRLRREWDYQNKGDNEE